MFVCLSVPNDLVNRSTGKIFKPPKVQASRGETDSVFWSTWIVLQFSEGFW